MSTINHTKAPWTVDPENPLIVNALSGPCEMEICEVYGTDPIEMAYADAHLIAAAPDLLFALKAVFACSSGDPANTQSHAAIYRACRAAIDKAEGRS